MQNMDIKHHHSPWSRTCFYFSTHLLGTIYNKCFFSWQSLFYVAASHRIFHYFSRRAIQFTWIEKKLPIIIIYTWNSTYMYVYMASHFSRSHVIGKLYLRNCMLYKSLFLKVKYISLLFIIKQIIYVRSTSSIYYIIIIIIIV